MRQDELVGQLNFDGTEGYVTERKSRGFPKAHHLTLDACARDTPHQLGDSKSKAYRSLGASHFTSQLVSETYVILPEGQAELVERSQTRSTGHHGVQ